jgi:catechol 2,3-dioxygenase-like lactoylglutathione lyase family enzyme
MGEWKKQIGAINVIAGDVEATKAFYRDVFGLTPLHEDETVAVFRFEETYVMVQRGPLAEGVGQFAILVEDVDAVRDELEGHGVSVLGRPPLGHAHAHLRRSGRLRVGDRAALARGDR